MNFFEAIGLLVVVWAVGEAWLASFFERKEELLMRAIEARKEG